jgi:hypothetical protein
MHPKFPGLDPGDVVKIVRCRFGEDCHLHGCHIGKVTEIKRLDCVVEVEDAKVVDKLVCADKVELIEKHNEDKVQMKLPFGVAVEEES